MAIQTGLEGKPWYYGLAVGLLFGGALYTATQFLALAEMRERIARQDQQLGELQTQLQKGRAAQRKLPQFREEVARLELELDKLLRVLPARRNTPELLRRIRALTQMGDFNILRVRPGNFVDRDFYSEWPIAIQLEGTYHDLALFFDRISRFSRIINIENLKITALRQASNKTISASFTAKTFIYKESTPEPEAPGGGR